METIIILLIILCCLFLFVGTYFYKEKFSLYDTFSVDTTLSAQDITPSINKNTSFLSDLQSQVSSLITNVSNTLSNNPSSSNSQQPINNTQSTTSSPISQNTTQPVSQMTATQPVSQMTATQPVSQMTATSEIPKYYNVSIPNGIWDGNLAGDYICPNATNVNTMGGNGKWSEYCIFNNVEDVQKYCNSSPSCLGYVTRGPNMYQVTNNPIKDPNGGAYYKKNIGNKPQYSYNKKYDSGWWDGNKPGEYICPGAINRNITDGNENWKNYCIFSNEIDAQNYCDADPSCLGYVRKDANMFQVTNNPVPDNNGGAYYQKQ
jgi:hypothetical protein